MSKRKYNHFKEKVNEFIGDNDEIIKANAPLEDLPSWIPEAAYFAYIDIWYPENPEDVDISRLEDSYQGEFGSLEDFVEYYFKSYRDSVYRGYDDFDDDALFSLRIADLYKIGDYILGSKYGQAVYEALDSIVSNASIKDNSGFIGDDDAESEEEFKEEEPSLFDNNMDNFIYHRMIEILTQVTYGDVEYILYDEEAYAKAYIMAVSEYTHKPYDTIVYDLQEENPNKKFLDWSRGVDYVFEDFAYYDGFVFSSY